LMRLSVPASRRAGCAPLRRSAGQKVQRTFCWSGLTRRNPAGLFRLRAQVFQRSRSAEISAANSFSSMKSGSRYCGKLLDILSRRKMCRHSPSISAKWSRRQPLVIPAATNP